MTCIPVGLLYFSTGFREQPSCPQGDGAASVWSIARPYLRDNIESCSGSGTSAKEWRVTSVHISLANAHHTAMP